MKHLTAVFFALAIASYGASATEQQEINPMQGINAAFTEIPLGTSPEQLKQTKDKLYELAKRQRTYYNQITGRTAKGKAPHLPYAWNNEVLLKNVVELKEDIATTNNDINIALTTIGESHIRLGAYFHTSKLKDEDGNLFDVEPFTVYLKRGAVYSVNVIGRDNKDNSINRTVLMTWGSDYGFRIDGTEIGDMSPLSTDLSQLVVEIDQEEEKPSFISGIAARLVEQ